MSSTPPQDEVARRLEAAGGPSSLRDLVLATPVGGRGSVDPDVVTRDGMIRVCVSSLAAWCASAPTVPHPPLRRRRRRPWGPAFLVVGSAPFRQSVSAGLAAVGHVEGGHRPVVLVVAAPLEAAVAGAWRDRVAHGSGRRWRRQWALLAARDALPSAGPAQLARSWVRRVGEDRVHVLAHPDAAGALRAAADMLGMAGPAACDGSAAPGSDVVDTDLLRRLNQALATRPDAVRRRPHQGDLSALLARPWTPVVGVPRVHRGWAVERGEELASDLAALPCVVRGDPRSVVPSTDPALPGSVDPADTLDRALGILLAVGRGETAWPAR